MATLAAAYDMVHDPMLSVGYAGVYAFANILLTIFGQVIVMVT
ncbi:MAG: hypothetical protein GWP06_15005 [Actinobacteria bacterium]|nr:hypothetical protein [Actinomycetota bacterium]